MFPEKVFVGKRCAIKKGALFYLLPKYILNVIDMWLIGIEHWDKLKAIVMQINTPRNSVLRTAIYQNW